MDPNRWKAVNEIFHAALDLPPGERDGFVGTASRGDPELHCEVLRMIQADSEAPDYMDSPLHPGDILSEIPSAPPPFEPGDLLKNRFRILRSVGEGGMGFVFEAQDTELNVRVALKAIRSEIASMPTAIDYFRREVRTARSITHPNVCRTYEFDRGTLNRAPLGHSGPEFLFLTMEFLEGETLGARLKRGPLPLPEALHLARQLAAALDAAHAAGIVHRDIKPGNIMLVPPAQTGQAWQTGQTGETFRRAVVTDFGLARQNALGPARDGYSISQAGAVGTLAYMAPEQLDSTRPATAATDVYAFGLVLFEAVTGRRAYPSDDLLSGLAQRLNGQPPSPRALVPELPEIWETVIHGCLRLQPETRFATAGQAIEALTGQRFTLPPNSLAALVPQTAPSRAKITLAQRRLRRWTVAACGIVVVAVSLFFLGQRFHWQGNSWWQGNPEVAAGALVYLAPIDNRTGDTQLDNLTELLRASLEQSAHINLLDQGRAGDIMERMTLPPETRITQEIGREIANRAGAARVVFSRVTGSAGRYTLSIDIQRPDYNPLKIRAHWPRTFAWQSTGISGSTAQSGTIPQELTGTLQDATDWIRHEVGESSNDIARLDAPPEDVTTGSWEALQDYTEAEKLVHSGHRDQAMFTLRAAIKKDPDFALAFGRLGDIEVNLLRTEDGYRDYLKALDASAGRRLSLRERDRIKGLYAMDTGDFQTAADLFQEYSSLYEHDYLGWYYRALPLSMLGRSPEAIQVLEMAHSVDSNGVGAPMMLVSENLILGDQSEANKWLDILRSMNDKEAAWFSEGMNAFVNGDISSANKFYGNLLASADPVMKSGSRRFLADLQAEQGNYSQAVSLLDPAMAGGKELAPTLLDRAYANGMAGDVKRCVEDVDQALQLDGSPETFLKASVVLGRVHFKSRSAMESTIRTSLAKLAARAPADNYGVISAETRYRVRGELLLAQGDSANALREFRKADSLEAPRVSREYLGRALEARAAQTRDAEEADRLRRRALDSYSFEATHPAVVWQLPTEYPPGAYAESLQDWLRVATSLGIRNSTFAATQKKLLRVRPPSSSIQAL